MNYDKPMRHVIQKGTDFQMDLCKAMEKALYREMKLMEDPNNLRAYNDNIDRHYGLIRNSSGLLVNSIRDVYKKYGYNVQLKVAGMEVIYISGCIDYWNIGISIESIESFNEELNIPRVYKQWIRMSIHFYMFQYKKTNDIEYKLLKKYCK